MNTDVFKQILVEEFHAKVQDNTYVLDEEERVAVMLSHDGGLMRVSKVHKVVFKETYVLFVTSEDRYVVDPSTVFGVRGDKSCDEREDARPGFRR